MQALRARAKQTPKPHRNRRPMKKLLLLLMTGFCSPAIHAQQQMADLPEVSGICFPDSPIRIPGRSSDSLIYFTGGFVTPVHFCRQSGCAAAERAARTGIRAARRDPARPGIPAVLHLDRRQRLARRSRRPEPAPGPTARRRPDPAHRGPNGPFGRVVPNRQPGRGLGVVRAHACLRPPHPEARRSAGDPPQHPRQRGAQTEDPRPGRRADLATNHP